jgi:uncharacterized protein
MPGDEIAAVYGCFLLLLMLTIAPAMEMTRKQVHAWLAVQKQRYFFLIGVWCLPYLLYAIGTQDFRWIALLRLFIVGASLVILYTAFPVRDRSRFAWQDTLAGVFLIAVVLWHGLSHVWNVPVGLDFMTRLFLIAVVSWLWVFIRPVPNPRYEATIAKSTLKAAGENFLLFALIAIPAGFALRFTAWNPRWRGGLQFGVDFLGIFLFIAVLEELFFRGFLQSLLSTSLGSWRWAQLLVSCLFGLFHILHAPFPNWRYVALASVAGWFYGSAFRGGGLMASSLTHAMVDTAWRTFLSKN